MGLTVSPRLMLMHTHSDRLPMDSLRLMPMPLVTHTMLESLLESTMAMVEYQAMVLLETVDHGYGSGYGGVYGGRYGGYYGKREADSDAYATGHPHNVGVITGVDYGYGRVSGYGAIGNRGYFGSIGYSGYPYHG